MVRGKFYNSSLLSPSSPAFYLKMQPVCFFGFPPPSFSFVLLHFLEATCHSLLSAHTVLSSIRISWFYESLGSFPPLYILSSQYYFKRGLRHYSIIKSDMKLASPWNSPAAQNLSDLPPMSSGISFLNDTHPHPFLLQAKNRSTLVVSKL